jgi:RNA polymerase sigma-70 factor (ECF subfamily)
MNTTARLQALLDQLHLGREGSRDALLEQSLGRVQMLARSMFRRQADLRQFDETDDVVSKALLRLHRALAKVTPADVRAFYGLAATHIRWVLRDLARQHGGRRLAYADRVPEPGADGEGPADLAEWAEFHEAVGGLPQEERELFDVLFYQGLEQAEAATVLGVPLRTLKRRWQRARLALRRRMDGHMPGGRP